MVQKKRVWTCETCQTVGCVVYEDGQVSPTGVHDLIIKEHGEVSPDCDGTIGNPISEISVANLVRGGAGVSQWARAEVAQQLETVGGC